MLIPVFCLIFFFKQIDIIFEIIFKLIGVAYKQRFTVVVQRIQIDAFRLSAAAQDERRMEMRCKGIQSEFQYDSGIIPA